MTGLLPVHGRVIPCCTIDRIQLKEVGVPRLCGSFSGKSQGEVLPPSTQLLDAKGCTYRSVAGPAGGGAGDDGQG